MFEYYTLTNDSINSLIFISSSCQHSILSLDSSKYLILSPQSMTPLIHQQADMLINNAHNTAEFSSNHESSELTSSLSHKEDLSIICQEIKTIAAETAEDAVMNILHHLNLLSLSHEFKSIEHIYDSSQVCQPHIIISAMSIQSILTMLSSISSHTHTEIIKSKNIDYFDLKLYAEFTISDSENDSTIHDVFLFVNYICKITAQISANKSISVELSL